jgi:hypothetical protein
LLIHVRLHAQKDGTSVNLADFLTPIISWVEDGVAPGEVEADTFSLTLQTIAFQQTVQPYDALAPVDSAPGSLNGHYDYIGSYSHHRRNSPGGA